MSEMIVQVHYPEAGGQLRLRTELDWNSDVSPEDTDGATARFRIATDRRHLAFKPVWLNGQGTEWSRGENYLWLDHHPPLDVFPYFRADAHCSACQLRELSAAGGGRKHRFRVFYPPGYHENTLERYPVVYLQDGQNLFFPDESFGGFDWKIDETLNALDGMNRIRRVIAVGVYPLDRMSDYTLPGYDEYGQFVARELVPWIDAHYRTIPLASARAVMGSSLGGVVSFHIGWTYPEVFGHAACLSSTFGFRDDLFERVAAEPRRPTRFYLDSGWPSDNYEVTRSMRNQLVDRGWRDGADLLYLAFPHARHNEHAWSTRTHIPLQFLFGT